MFEIVVNGLLREVSQPLFGKQDVGIVPGGAMDRFSHAVGNILLGNSETTSALEIIIPPKLRFTSDCFFVLTGAEFDQVILTTDSDKTSEKEIAHGTVYRAKAGSQLQFGVKLYGLRTYFCCQFCNKVDSNPLGRAWEMFKSVYDCDDPNRYVRVIEGPEYEYLNEQSRFFDTTWQITQDLNNMGMRLAADGEPLTVSIKNMISEAVNDGTIQLTPNGPIILLRGRQTVGGYPRIFNVISADMDLLGQYSALKNIRFKKVSIQKAIKLAQKKRKMLDRLKKSFS